MDLMKNVTIKPVYVDDEVQLYDIYLDGVWIGSRRTTKQVEVELENRKVVSIHPSSLVKPS